MAKKFFLSFICLLLFLSADAQSWQQLNDFPSTERDDGVAFVIGNHAYCGTGLNVSFAACNDFYVFDMSTDQWNTIASLPTGAERQYATGFSSATFGFTCGGIGSTYFNDVWQYDPILNTWTAKTPLPSVGRSGAASFVINNIAYVVGGKTSSSIAMNEVWAYDMVNDIWQSKNNLPFGSRWRASGATLNNKGYLIFGRDQNARYCQELFEYDPTLDTWTQISTFPGAGRAYSSLSAISGDLVVLAGLDTFEISHNNMWDFNVTSMSWHQLNSIPSAGRRGGMCFNNSTAIYYTTGIDQTNTRLKETWKCTNPTSTTETGELEKIKLYPNPTNDLIIIEYPNFILNQNLTFTLFDIIGNIILQKQVSAHKTLISLSAFSEGLYFIRLQDENSCVIKKLLKQ